MNKFLTSIVAWLRAGYPEGIPPTDYFPVLALLSRRLSHDEVKAVSRELMQRRPEFDDVDIGVMITQLTDELPSEEDVERVRERLAAKGWPFDEPHDAEAEAISSGRRHVLNQPALGQRGKYARDRADVDAGAPGQVVGPEFAPCGGELVVTKP